MDNLNIKIDKLEHELSEIKARNKKVEDDKAWEGSVARKVLIATFTYLAIALYMAYIRIDHPWLDAIIPTVGFLLSTLTMSWFKDRWLRKKRK